MTVAYDAPREDVVAAYRTAFDTLDRVSYELRGDTLIVGASIDPGFLADVSVHFRKDSSTTIVHAGFSYDIVDRFEHFPMLLERAATELLPVGSAALIPEQIYPADLARCDAPPLPTDAAIVPPEMLGGVQSLKTQIYYPPNVKKSGVEGSIFAGFVVDERNRVVCVEIISGLPAGLNGQMIGAILATDFRAGTVDGVPTPMRGVLPWSFRAVA
ncbi:MAG: hypothetical protein HKN13_00390, partial [Rhodothermales bacterium]|nr:hypothetical protein [Rhodothermales bacterium]